MTLQGFTRSRQGLIRSRQGFLSKDVCPLTVTLEEPIITGVVNNYFIDVVYQGGSFWGLHRNITQFTPDIEKRYITKHNTQTGAIESGFHLKGGGGDYDVGSFGVSSLSLAVDSSSIYVGVLASSGNSYVSVVKNSKAGVFDDAFSFGTPPGDFIPRVAEYMLHHDGRVYMFANQTPFPPIVFGVWAIDDDGSNPESIVKPASLGVGRTFAICNDIIYLQDERYTLTGTQLTDFSQHTSNVYGNHENRDELVTASSSGDGWLIYNSSETLIDDSLQIDQCQNGFVVGSVDGKRVWATDSNVYAWLSSETPATTVYVWER